MMKAVNQDYKPAQDIIGLIYLCAPDINENYRLAKPWLLKAADRNQPEAWNGLGLIYSQGLGADVNAQEAIRCFRKSADLGFGAADANLGVLYYEGKVVPRTCGKQQPTSNKPRGEMMFGQHTTSV